MSDLLQTHRLFIGTYTRSTSEGIYSLSLDEKGRLGTPAVAAKAPNPTFLALAPGGGILYAVCASPNWLSSFRVDASSAALTPIDQRPAGKDPTPCHVSVGHSGRLALAANYHLGKAAIIPLGPDGMVGTPYVVTHEGKGPNPKRQNQAHVHSTYFTPDGRRALVCDLGLDKVFSYVIDPAAPSLSPAAPPWTRTTPAAGPRHLAFAPGGKRLFVVNELDCTVVPYGLDASGALHPGAPATLLPASYRGDATAAEVAVHPNGRFVYGSCRGPDTISVFEAGERLSPIEIYPCGGKGPRSFALSPDGAWLVCAHQDSDSVCSFRVDPRTGTLDRVQGAVSIPMPVCVTFLS
ncbi:MAG TPA: lactonase family protein [Opitutaceae bacterium]|jgi:6-phosphogluconolactonase